MMSNQKVIMSPLNSQNPVFRVLLVFLQLKVVPSVTLLSSSRPTLYNNINNEHMCYNIITQYNTLIIHFTLTSALPHWMQLERRGPIESNQVSSCAIRLLVKHQNMALSSSANGRPCVTALA